MKWKQVLNVLLALAVVVTMLPMLAMAAPPPASQVEVEPELQAQLETDGTTGYLIYFRAEPDLTPAYKMTWVERGEFVMNALQETADQSQARVREYLDAQGVEYKAYWIDNIISVPSSTLATVEGLSAFPEIEIVRARRHPILYEPVDINAAADGGEAIEPNLTHINVDQVWSMGITGSGITVANIDTGVNYGHAALVGQYRGNLGGGSFDHNYNWWDPLLGGQDLVPNDWHDHGSHTMGIMLGDDGGSNQIGMAPGANWLACQAFESSDDELLDCGQFMLAPWDLTGANPNSALRPHIVNNSWGDCLTSLDTWYKGTIAAWHAAGIYPVFSNGNNSNCGWPAPAGCNSVGNPGRYGNVTGVGSTGRDDGLYATHSNWGPTDDLDTVNPGGYASIKPQVAAPGVSIRSAGNSGDEYVSMGGTSMASPHVAGLIALMWEACPTLIGDYATTETMIQDTAVAIPYASGCGGEGPGNVPNQATGWGEIDAQAAVLAALAHCGGAASGYLDGYVTNATSGDPIAGAQVIATASGPAEAIEAITDPSGYYTMTLLAGFFDVTASALNYAPQTVTSVEITDGSVTSQDFQLVYLGGWSYGPSDPPFQYNRLDAVFNPNDSLIYFPGGRTGGGTHDKSIRTYDPVGDIWADTGCDMNENAANFTAALIENDGTGRGEAIYIIGGYDVVTASNIRLVQRYYPSQPGCVVETVATDPFPGLVAGLTVGAGGIGVVNDKIYYFGGWENTTAPYFSAQTWEYDPTAAAGSRWSEISGATLSPPRAYIATAVQDGKIYAMGGIDYFDAIGIELDPTNVVEVFDPANPGAGWVALSNMPVATGSARGFGFDADTQRQGDGKLYVVGGGDWPGESAEAIEYDIATDTWTQAFPDLNQARRDHAGTYVPLDTPDPTDGLPGMWVFGGNVGADDPPFGRPEYFAMGGQALVASFVAEPEQGCAPLAVQFTDTSTALPPAIDWLWDFGDGAGTSTQQNPGYTYDAADTYTVTLTVTNPNGSDSASETVTVYASPAANFSWSPTPAVAGEAVTFSDASTGPVVDWLWDFSDGYQYTVQDPPPHTFAGAGTYHVTLTVTSTMDCADTIAKQVLVREEGTLFLYLPIVVRNY